jgi:hypothetical protein
MRLLLAAFLFVPDSSGPIVRGKPLAIARVEYVDRAFGMVAVTAGEPDGVDAGCAFQVVRPGPSGLRSIAAGSFASYLGAAHTGCKISVVKGNVNDIRLGDKVLIHRLRRPPP